MNAALEEESFSDLLYAFTSFNHFLKQSRDEISNAHILRINFITFFFFTRTLSWISCAIDVTWGFYSIRCSHVWNTVFPESEKTNPIEYIVPPNCETAQAKKWQDIAKHMDMSKVALTFPLCIVIFSTWPKHLGFKEIDTSAFQSCILFTNKSSLLVAYAFLIEEREHELNVTLQDRHSLDFFHPPLTKLFASLFIKGRSNSATLTVGVKEQATVSSGKMWNLSPLTT